MMTKHVDLPGDCCFLGVPSSDSAALLLRPDLAVQTFPWQQHQLHSQQQPPLSTLPKVEEPESQEHQAPPTEQPRPAAPPSNNRTSNAAAATSKRNRRTKHPVWELFRRTSSGQAQCQLCSALVRSPCSSNFMGHLNRHHAEHYQAIYSRWLNGRRESSSSSSSSSSEWLSKCPSSQPSPQLPLHPTLSSQREWRPLDSGTAGFCHPLPYPAGDLETASGCLSGSAPPLYTHHHPHHQTLSSSLQYESPSSCLAPLHYDFHHYFSTGGFVAGGGSDGGASG